MEFIQVNYYYIPVAICLCFILYAQMVTFFKNFNPETNSYFISLLILLNPFNAGLFLGTLPFLVQVSFITFFISLNAFFLNQHSKLLISSMFNCLINPHLFPILLVLNIFRFKKFTDFQKIVSSSFLIVFSYFIYKHLFNLHLPIELGVNFIVNAIFPLIFSVLNLNYVPASLNYILLVLMFFFLFIFSRDKKKSLLSIFLLISSFLGFNYFNWNYAFTKHSIVVLNPSFLFISIFLLFVFLSEFVNDILKIIFISFYIIQLCLWIPYWSSPASLIENSLAIYSNVADVRAVDQFKLTLADAYLIENEFENASYILNELSKKYPEDLEIQDKLAIVTRIKKK